MSERRLISSLPWKALRAFEAVARLGSFQAAARELAVTPTAISHQIRTLEEHLGMSLFERLHRSLRLTSAGDVLAAAALASFLGLEQALARLVTDGAAAGASTLTVTSASSFAAKWLAPRLHGFAAIHPEIELRLQSGDNLVDLRRDVGVDLALRYGSGAYGDGLHAERLWPKGEIIPVCAPAVAATLKEPSGLALQTLIRTAPVPNSGGTASPSGWLAWFDRAGIADPAILAAAGRGPVLSNTQLAMEAAAAGRGVALAPAILVQGDLESGRLTRPFAAGLPDPHGFWLIYLAGRSEEARIRAFARWIRSEVGASNPG